MNRCCLLSRIVICVFLLGWLPCSGQASDQQEQSPIVYTIGFPDLQKHKASITATIPTDKRPTIELMMPIWSPGFYRVENYANQVENFTASARDGTKLVVEQPRKNRWIIQTNGSSEVIISYQLLCNARFVTKNWVGEDYAVFNGPATFITLADKQQRPHEVKLELPATWKQTMSGLEEHQDKAPNHYRARNYDILVDSPIVAGNLTVNEFEVEGSKHYLAAFGDVAQWDGNQVAKELEKIVRENQHFWKQLPFKKYVFLIALRQGGGGLEHLNSTYITISPMSTRPGKPNLSWLSLVCHEYVHAFNVKRLRPIELGPFDYEKEPRTSGLWVAEGLTSYIGDLLLCRSGLSTQDNYLGQMSGHINQLQNNPGRLLQTLEQASTEVWTSSMSGVGGSNKTVSYYVKGPVVGFLLDAHIRKSTKGIKSLDDVMRLAFDRYSGEKGFTADQFRETCEEVAGHDLKDWFHRALKSTEELDYSEALEWYGLQFTTPDMNKPTQKWRLRPVENPTKEQAKHLKDWLIERR